MLFLKVLVFCIVCGSISTCIDKYRSAVFQVQVYVSLRWWIGKSRPFDTLGWENGFKHVMEFIWSQNANAVLFNFFLVVLTILFPSCMFLWMSNERGVLVASFIAVKGAADVRWRTVRICN